MHMLACVMQSLLPLFPRELQHNWPLCTLACVVQTLLPVCP
jgi:hypothetical protein